MNSRDSIPSLLWTLSEVQKSQHTTITWMSCDLGQTKSSGYILNGWVFTNTVTHPVCCTREPVTLGRTGFFTFPAPWHY